MKMLHRSNPTDRLYRVSPLVPIDAPQHHSPLDIGTNIEHRNTWCRHLSLISRLFVDGKCLVLGDFIFRRPLEGCRRHDAGAF